MKCLKCDAEIPDYSKFCPECGEKIEIDSKNATCLECGAKIPKESKFCLECGAKIQKKAEAKAPAQVFCTRCGTKNEAVLSFCTQCGNVLQKVFDENGADATPYQQTPYQQTPYQQGYYQQTPYQQNPYQQGYYQQNSYRPVIEPVDEFDDSLEDEALISNLLGENENYYLRTFRKMKRDGTNASWNWSAFFFLSYWLVYRKMYGWGMLFLGIDLFMTALGNPVVTMLSLIGFVFFGIFANRLYYGVLYKKKEMAKSIPEENRFAYYEEEGGVNNAATALIVVVRVICVLMIMSTQIAMLY